MCTLNVGSSFWKRLSAREKLGVSVPIGLMASEMTGSGTNIEVCKPSHLSNSIIPVGTAQFAHHRIVRGSIGKRVPGRALDTKDRTDLAWTNLTDVLESTLRFPHLDYKMDTFKDTPPSRCYACAPAWEP
jgi:hypothetical protein